MRPPRQSPIDSASPEVIDVRVEGLAPGGDAIGRQEGGLADGRATFVALAAPGERVRARVTRQKARVAWAELIEILEPSALRVEPPCPLFGRCGGCQWQHVDLGAQRAAKQAIVARALKRADGALAAPVPDGWGYRDRAQFIVGPAGVIGFRARRSHDVVDVSRCLLLGPALDAALAAIRASAPVFEVDTEIDLQAGREGVHVALRLPRGSGSLRGVASKSTAEVPTLFSALLDDWRGAGVVGLRVVAAGREIALGAVDVDIAGAGGAGSADEAPLRIPAGAFAQVGHAGNRALVDAVLREVGSDPGAVLELYAGSGNFTRGLVARASAVIACDADRAAVMRGRRNVPTAVWMARPPGVVEADTVVLDPPRDGLDAENLRAVVQARRRVVYVSCDPQTLGRDANRLAQSGLTLQSALALDLMPHTFHVEVVARFDRA